MFGRSANQLIQRAEDAMRQGRLDEAFAIASSPALGGDREARSVLKKVGGALLERGQEHLLARRFADALNDFDRAERCGLDGEKIADWRRRARDARDDFEKNHGRQQAALADARRQLAAGSIAGAREAKDRAPMDNTMAADVSRAISGQAERAEAALSAAKSALKDGDLARAAECVRKAASLHRNLEGLSRLEGDVIDRVMKEAAQCFADGRLTRCRDALKWTDGLGRGRSDVGELGEALRLAGEASAAVREDRYAEAGVVLGRLKQAGPKAAWIDVARQQLDALDRERRALLAGSLGLLFGKDRPKTAAARRAALDETVSARPAVRGDERVALADDAGRRDYGILPRRLLLRIDGVGSFLLLRGDRIGIGRAGSRTADLELISDLSERQAEIIRAGEDYFLVSGGGVELAGRAVDHALLQDGDRVRLGKRVRLTFRRPTLKSTAAALDLGEGVRTTSDCRRAILWSGPVLMGSSRDCHVRLGPRFGGMVLIERGGQVQVKPMGPGGAATPLPLGETVAIGDLRLSIQPATGGSGPGRVIG